MTDQPKRRRKPRKPKAAVVPYAERNSEVRLKALEMLLTGYSQNDVANELGIPSGTVYRWTQDRGFQKDLAEVRKARRAENEEKLHSLIPLALKAAEEILTDPKAPEWAKLRAMENILQRTGFAPSTGDPGQGGSQFSAVVDLFSQRLGIHVRGPNQKLQPDNPPGQGLGPDRGWSPPALPPGHDDAEGV